MWAHQVTCELQGCGSKCGNYDFAKKSCFTSFDYFQVRARSGYLGNKQGIPQL